MRVNVDDIAFMDRRFKLLGGRLGMAWQEALGRCLPVWALAYAKRTPILPAGDVDALAERAGFAAAMVAVELASDEPSDTVYLCGVNDRIDFLLMQDAKREKAREARLAAAGVKKSPGPSRGKRNESLGPSRGDVPGTGSYSPDLAPDLDLAPEDQKLTLPRDPAVPVPPRVESPDCNRPRILQPTSDFATEAGQTPDRAGQIPATGDLSDEQQGYNHDDARARGRLAGRIYRAVSDARIAIAAELQLPSPLPFPPIAPGTSAGSFRDLRDRVREEGSAAPVVCWRIVANLTAQAREDRSVEWLAEKAFREGAWRTAREWLPIAQRPRAGPRRSAERARTNPAVDALFADIAAREAAGET